MIKCSSCKSENFFIEFSGIKEEEGVVNRFEPVAICRSCGEKFAFRYSDLPKQEVLLAEITDEHLEKLKQSFFWYDDKQLQQKYSIIFNIYQFKRFKEIEFAPEQDSSCMVIEFDLEAAEAIIAGRKKLITGNEETAFRGLVLLQDRASGLLLGSAVLTDCKRLIGAGITTYPERLQVPSEEDPEHAFTQFMNTELQFPRLYKFACILEDAKKFDVPVAYKYGAGFLRGTINF